MQGLVFCVGLSDLFVSYCQVLSFGWDMGCLFKSKGQDNVPLISARSGLLAGIW